MILANCDEPDNLDKGVMAKSIPESVAMITVHVVVVKNDVVGNNNATYCVIAETSRAVPSKRNNEMKVIGFLASSFKASLSPTSSMTEVSALLQWLNFLAKGTSARSIGVVRGPGRITSEYLRGIGMR